MFQIEQKALTKSVLFRNGSLYANNLSYPKNILTIQRFCHRWDVCISRPKVLQNLTTLKVLNQNENQIKTFVRTVSSLI